MVEWNRRMRYRSSQRGKQKRRLADFVDVRVPVLVVQRRRRPVGDAREEGRLGQVQRRDADAETFGHRAQDGVLDAHVRGQLVGRPQAGRTLPLSGKYIFFKITRFGRQALTHFQFLDVDEAIVLGQGATVQVEDAGAAGRAAEGQSFDEHAAQYVGVLAGHNVVRDVATAPRQGATFPRAIQSRTCVNWWSPVCSTTTWHGGG